MRRLILTLLALRLLVGQPADVGAQDRSGAISGIAWADDGVSFEYQHGGTPYRYDIATRSATRIEPADPRTRSGGTSDRRPGPIPARGRQHASAISPDGRFKAFYRDHNLWLSEADGTGEAAVTTDGSAKTRVKYGSASWVYGEELDQLTAIWWSPAGTKLAFYRFDEAPVPDYYLQLDQTRVQSTVDAEAYPKAGASNPIADVLVYDLATRRTVRVDVRDGQPFTNDVVGHYVYGIHWTPDGTALTLHRTNRRQNVMELAACSPDNGKCRTVVREEWPASWVENTPAMRYLEDGRRFIWTSERTGWKNFYLYDLSGRLHATLTKHQFEVAEIVRVDERGGVLFYTARDGDNHMKRQLHRVRLNGTQDRRLTDPAFHHTVDVAPNGRYFLDITEAHNRPPATSLRAADGAVVAELARSAAASGTARVELFTFPAADGETTLHGMLHFPSNFDATRKYPLLVRVYAGPATNGASETFTSPHPLTEQGFLVATFDSRGAAGRGKRFLDIIYQRLGTVEVDDQAAGVQALWKRPYVDRERVGIFGSSYGGYVSVMALLRHPDLFQAACASSAVTDWRHYDTIYTERYMWIPQENREGYDAGSAVRLAANLRGNLMLYYGTADNNVHPSNTLQLIAALQTARKSFEVQVGPDRGHTALDLGRMTEFFSQHLMAPGRGSRP